MLDHEKKSVPFKGREDHVLEALFAIIEKRHRQFVTGKGGNSRTVKLFQKGASKIAQKVGEEATEVVIEAVQNDPAMLIEESADLLYFLLVLWKARGVSPTQIWAELSNRYGLAEVEERAMRAQTKKMDKLEK